MIAHEVFVHVNFRELPSTSNSGCLHGALCCFICRVAELRESQSQELNSSSKTKICCRK